MITKFSKQSKNWKKTQEKYSQNSDGDNQKLFKQIQTPKLFTPSNMIPVSNVKDNYLSKTLQKNDASKLLKPKQSLKSNTQIINSEKTTNIKVFARFRPFNKSQTQLTTNGFGSNSTNFIDQKTVQLPEQSMVFTLDKILPPFISQDEVFETVGKETVKDVLNGYNGTVFAYGQTGSGKTYTMIGEIFNDHLKGIIPRSISDIFNHINSCQQQIQFTLMCSILQIYRQNLFDLLSDHKDLKIKQSPAKGVYVQGLTEVSICTEKQLYSVLQLSQNSRRIAATRLNENSSRSHTLFMVQIRQTLADSQKKGKLNLVDLAGSQKVAKTGAVGCTLQQAKKINFSLSCLGNVIHALTNGNDYIPYRDSKLTRILSQSIGGNFKTSLIVTCSTHSSSVEQTISTLKFATRAKSIKNHYKMNIKSSPQQMEKIIAQLRNELIEVKIKLQRVGIKQKDIIKQQIQFQHEQAHQLIKNSQLLKSYKNPFKRNISPPKRSEEIKYLKPPIKRDQSASNASSDRLQNLSQQQLKFLKNQIDSLKKQNEKIKKQMTFLELENSKLKSELSIAPILQQKRYLQKKIKQNQITSSKVSTLVQDLQIILRQFQNSHKKHIKQKWENYEKKLTEIKPLSSDSSLMNSITQKFIIQKIKVMLPADIQKLFRELRSSISNLSLINKTVLNEIQKELQNTDRQNKNQIIKYIKYELLKQNLTTQIISLQIDYIVFKQGIKHQTHNINNAENQHKKETILNLEEAFNEAVESNHILRQKLNQYECRQQQPKILKSRVLRKVQAEDILNQQTQKRKEITNYQNAILNLHKEINNEKLKSKKYEEQIQKQNQKIHEFKAFNKILEDQINQYMIEETKIISEMLVAFQKQAQKYQAQISSTSIQPQQKLSIERATNIDINTQAKSSTRIETPKVKQQELNKHKQQKKQQQIKRKFKSNQKYFRFQYY